MPAVPGDTAYCHRFVAEQNLERRGDGAVAAGVIDGVVAGASVDEVAGSAAADDVIARAAAERIDAAAAGERIVSAAAGEAIFAVAAVERRRFRDRAGERDNVIAIAGVDEHF